MQNLSYLDDADAREALLRLAEEAAQRLKPKEAPVARDITEDMKLAAAHAIAALCDEKELGPENIIPGAFDPRVADAVAEEVASAAEKAGIARKPR